ncbi:MAG TPA: IPT/TIG domain-containing protein [Pyrinomonadaceae bacterium]|nr:IPT/TIG domain-containing protein [Pyrinomonadaceae bacterium]
MRRSTPRALFAAALAALCLSLLAGGRPGSAQGEARGRLTPDTQRARASRQRLTDAPTRPGARTPQRTRQAINRSTRAAASSPNTLKRRPATHAPQRPSRVRASAEAKTTVMLSGIPAGTPLGRVLHVSQLSLVNSDGTHEQFLDRDGDLVADDRTTFDFDGGSYDIAVGRSGARYEVFTAIDDRGTTRTSDDIPVGVLVLALDTNGDFRRDTSSAFDLGRDFRMPSAVSVVSGTSKAGREFVVVSSSGFFNSDDPEDPRNEESPGVVLLIRDALTGGFDPARSRELVSVGDNRLFNANGLALLPTGDLVIADFQSNELRVVRDTDSDGVPDTLDPAPFYTFPLSAGAEDAPLDVAANSRGVVFTHSVGDAARLLAVYDTNDDRRADTDEIAVEGLSIDNNLVLHGLTVARDGTIYVIEDAMGETDAPEDGGNGGIPRVDAYPDPALNGFLRDGAVYVLADDEFTQAFSGLSFGVETVLPPVARLTMTNSASLQGDAARGALAAINGTGLTRGASGATAAQAAAAGLRVRIEGVSAPVLSFNDAQVHVYVPQELGAGPASVVVTVGGNVTAADDVRLVAANPGLFTASQTGTGEAIALLASGMRYTAGPFAATTDGQPSVIALLGTGWRNSPPVAVHIGGKPAAVQYAGPSGGFNGLDQLNVVVPAGVNGAAPVIVTTANGAASRAGVFITLQ